MTPAATRQGLGTGTSDALSPTSAGVGEVITVMVGLRRMWQGGLGLGLGGQ